MHLINRTPHAVTFVDADGDIIGSVQPDRDADGRPIVARVAVETGAPLDFLFSCAGSGDDLIRTGLTVPMQTSRLGAEITGLPDEMGDTMIIVSAQVATALPDRTDLVVPNDTIRDPDGQVIGCRALARVLPPAGAARTARQVPPTEAEVQKVEKYDEFYYQCVLAAFELDPPLPSGVDRVLAVDSGDADQYSTTLDDADGNTLVWASSLNTYDADHAVTIRWLLAGLGYTVPAEIEVAAGIEVAQ